LAREVSPSEFSFASFLKSAPLRICASRPVILALASASERIFAVGLRCCRVAEGYINRVRLHLPVLVLVRGIILLHLLSVNPDRVALALDLGLSQNIGAGEKELFFHRALLVELVG
jgi:hypothetical protein